MIANRANRLDPSLMRPEEMEQLVSAFAKPGQVSLVDDQGQRTEIPRAFLKHLTRIVRLMSEKRAVVLIPEDETFTTQAAANYLGMSRQHLVDLLEDGKIPFHKVGTHRRILFKDLLSFEKTRDKQRKAALDGLFQEIEEAGHYESDYSGDR